MENKKVIMIFQATEGKSRDEIFDTYSKATAKLVIEGYKVYNPGYVVHEQNVENKEIKNLGLHQLSKDIQAMAKCDVVYFCKDWEKDEKCARKHFLAIAYDLEVLYE